MGNRSEFSAKLKTILGSDETHFQPPASVRMKYPAAVYRIENIAMRKADNIPYFLMNCYEVIIIHIDPDEDWITPMLNMFPYSRFVRSYTKSNLYHKVFRVYF